MRFTGLGIETWETPISLFTIQTRGIRAAWVFGVVLSEGLHGAFSGHPRQSCAVAFLAGGGEIGNAVAPGSARMHQLAAWAGMDPMTLLGGDAIRAEDMGRARSSRGATSLE